METMPPLPYTKESAKAAIPKIVAVSRKRR
jgi:hypothetical protein